MEEAQPEEFLREKHIGYIANHGEGKNNFEYFVTEFLRLSGVYWGVAAIDILDRLDKFNKKSIVEFVKRCYCPKTGGFSACENHDPHILYTLSAIQILCIYDSLHEINVDNVGKYVASLQQPDGSFSGDKWGEIDTRFSFCAVATLTLMNRLHVVDIRKATSFILSCCNPDGGFGSKRNAESHAGLIYCCVGFLSITHQLHQIDCEKLAWWLCERQLPSGGLNGRPEKLPDVCYSWWVLASLSIMGKTHWLDSKMLQKFILSCQDTETGGFSDRTGNIPDLFHTLFGIGALSLLGYGDLKAINPTFCMPQQVMDKLGISPQILK